MNIFVTIVARNSKSSEPFVKQMRLLPAANVLENILREKSRSFLHRVEEKSLPVETAQDVRLVVEVLVRPVGISFYPM